MELHFELVKWGKLIGSEGFECIKAVKLLYCALEDRFVIEV